MRRRTLLAGLAGLALPGGLRAATPCADRPKDPRPQNLGREEIGQDLDAIRARGFAEAAVYEDFAPWSWVEDGAVRGIDVEIARLVAAALGVEARIRPVQAGETVETDFRAYVTSGTVLKEPVSNLLMHAPQDPELACRNELVLLTAPYARDRIAIAYRTEAYPDRAPVPAYFRFDPVAVVNDSLADFYLSTLSNGMLVPMIRRFPGPAEAMAALARGDVPAAMGARAELEHRLAPGLALHTPPLPGLAIGAWTVGIAVRKTFRDLGYAVEDAVAAAVADGRIAALFAAHGLTWEAPAA